MCIRDRIVCVCSALVAVLLLWFLRARQIPSSNPCINNLRQIEGAKQQWALENGKNADDVPSWANIEPYLGRGDVGSTNGIRCPKGGVYTIGRVKDAPKCSVPAHQL